MFNGMALSQWKQQFLDGRVPFAQALDIAGQIASALDDAHAQKILHLDLKPANVMVEAKPDGMLVVRVLGFGLAAKNRHDMECVSNGNTCGVHPYQAPELWQWDECRLSPATDQFALAIIFHELITGKLPSAGIAADNIEAMMAINRGIMQLDSSICGNVRAALTKALARKPESRFKTWADFVAALTTQ